MPIEILKNVRPNSTTGELDFYFPLRITDKSVLDSARLNGLEIGLASLYNHTFRAVMIPCKRTAHDAQGNQVYLDTPSEEQRRIFTAYAGASVPTWKRRGWIAAAGFRTPMAQVSSAARADFRTRPIHLEAISPRPFLTTVKDAPSSASSKVAPPFCSPPSTTRMTRERKRSMNPRRPGTVLPEIATRTSPLDSLPSSMSATPSWCRWQRSWCKNIGNTAQR